MQDYDVYNRPDKERLFTADEIAGVCGVHKTTVFSVALQLQVERLREGQKVFFPYVSMRKIVAKIGKKKVTKEPARSELVTDERCLRESWFPDPIPECLKDY